MSNKITEIKKSNRISRESLSREILIKKGSEVSVLEKGFSKNIYGESVEILISVGNDHTASLIMQKAAYDSLCAGAELTTHDYDTMTKKYYEPIPE